MLLADSRASFEIEGDNPPTNRLEHCARAILEAGKRPLNQSEIYQLHGILIGNDDSFTPMGYREDSVFLVNCIITMNPCRSSLADALRTFRS